VCIVVLNVHCSVRIFLTSCIFDVCYLSNVPFPGGLYCCCCTVSVSCTPECIPLCHPYRRESGFDWKSEREWQRMSLTGDHVTWNAFPGWLTLVPSTLLASLFMVGHPSSSMERSLGTPPLESLLSQPDDLTPSRRHQTQERLHGPRNTG
jgi:hypothetical protein